MSLRSTRARCRSARGAELVEFALVFPLVIVGIVAVIEMGLLFTQYEALNNAVREGARLASIPGSLDADVIEQVAAYAGAAGLDTALLDTKVVPVPVKIGGRDISSVRVTAEYPYHYAMLEPVFRMAGGKAFSSLTLKAAATMRKEVVAGL